MTTQGELYEMEDTDLDAVSGGQVDDWQRMMEQGGDLESMTKVDYLFS